MGDCSFGHYLVTTIWTYSHDDFELVMVGFPYGLTKLVIYVRLCIIYFH